MKMSLLDIVQDIMSDMNSDYVNSISETEEALQVAQIVKSTFFEMINRRDWPHLRKMMPLVSFGNAKYPTYLMTPRNTKRLEWLTYSQETRDKQDIKSFKELIYKNPEDFVRYTNNRDETKDEVSLFESLNGVVLKIDTSTPPSFWTSFDDNYIVLDSFDSDIEDTVQGVHSQAMLLQFPSWTNEDSFIPELPDAVFPALLAEAKSTCFIILKSVPNQKAEQQSVRQQRFLSSQGWKNHGGIKYPNYGRRSMK